MKGGGESLGPPRLGTGRLTFYVLVLSPPWLQKRWRAFILERQNVRPGDGGNLIGIQRGKDLQNHLVQSTPRPGRSLGKGAATYSLGRMASGQEGRDIPSQEGQLLFFKEGNLRKCDLARIIKVNSNNHLQLFMQLCSAESLRFLS